MTQWRTAFESSTPDPAPCELTDGQPVAEVVDAVPHDHHPGYVSDSCVLQVRAGVTGAVRMVRVLVVPLMSVFPQHSLTLVVVVGCRSVESVLVDGVEAVTVRMVHDFLLFHTKVIFGRGFLLAF